MATQPVDLPVDFSTAKWATPDADAKALFPKHGIFRDVLEDLVESTDAPAIYHLASVFTVAAAALGQCDLHTINAHGKTQILPMILWSAIIGDSGDRKSSAIAKSIISLEQTARERMLPADGSQEGWHLALSEQPISLLYRDELAGLFDATQRSYSTGLRTWLLDTWTGRDMVRKTLTHQETLIQRPRLSILGGIPPTVFSKKTSKDDWQSGFLARFIYWGGKRQRWTPMSHGDCSGKFTTWLNKVALRSTGHIILNADDAEPLTDWVRDKIQLRLDLYGSEVKSTINRLQEVGYKLAAIYELSLQTQPFGLGTTNQHITISRKSVVAILPILENLRVTTELLFNATSATQEISDEHSLLKLFENGKKYTRAEISAMSGLSYRSTTRILTDLLAADAIQLTLQHATPPKMGPPFKMYSRKVTS